MNAVQQEPVVKPCSVHVLLTVNKHFSKSKLIGNFYILLSIPCDAFSFDYNRLYLSQIFILHFINDLSSHRRALLATTGTLLPKKKPKAFHVYNPTSNS